MVAFPQLRAAAVDTCSFYLGSCPSCDGSVCFLFYITLFTVLVCPLVAAREAKNGKRKKKDFCTHRPCGVFVRHCTIFTQALCVVESKDGSLQSYGVLACGVAHVVLTKGACREHRFFIQNENSSLVHAPRQYFALLLLWMRCIPLEPFCSRAVMLHLSLLIPRKVMEAKVASPMSNVNQCSNTIAHKCS